MLKVDHLLIKIMRGLDNVEMGKIGEKLGKAYLKSLGFKQCKKPREFTCFDDFMCKDKKVYYIEYKSKQVQGEKFDYIVELTTEEQVKNIRKIKEKNIPFLLVIVFFKSNGVEIKHYTQEDIYIIGRKHIRLKPELFYPRKSSILRNYTNV
ncbi:MAG: hypothetical protein RMJ17_03065 [Candidatus Aenigmarchaeota archaeon]|nr:hypothetical protein [Candidatus Aenigmarchaeota archaeon]MDW8149547.1 hypothetical protein [Candidatus Aenigmarchaeota archaeon]